MLHTYFIENNHRSTVTLHPDTGLASEIESAEKNRLATIKKKMSLPQLEKFNNEQLLFYNFKKPQIQSKLLHPCLY